MKVSIVTAAESSALAVKALELDEEVVDLFSSEGLSASLRRAASFLCPATPRQVVDSVIEAVGPLGDGDFPTRDDLMDQLDLLISTGDLLELRQTDSRSTRLLFLGPPSYVEREAGRYLVLGVRPFGVSLVGSSLGSEVLYEGHTRTMELDPKAAACHFAALGLHQISRDRWVARPAQFAATALVEQYAQRFSGKGQAGNVEGLTILDSSAPVRFYRGRWRTLKPTDAGDFVARRPQAYGADLWCFVRVVGGLPQRLVDFPVEDPTVPGRDEAWRLQAAIDATRNQPQVYRVGAAGSAGSDVMVDFFGPVPSWAERYLELVGLAVQPSRGSLFSYRVPQGAMPALAEFLTDMLWMPAAHLGGTE
jgi:hypothetical protein